MALMATGQRIAIAGVPDGGVEMPEWRWRSGKVFRVEPACPGS